MSAHFNALTGQFLLSEQLVHAGKNQFYDLQSGNIVFGDLLVPKLGNTLFDGITLDLNFAKNLSLTDSVSGDNLVTFTRASSGTYVGADGLIKTSPVNLLTYSDYSQVAGTTDAQLEGTATAPDGTNTARRYSTPSTGLDIITKAITGGVAGNDYTFSVWVRSTGVATSVRLSVGDPALDELKDITTTWQRYSITKTDNASNLVRAYVQMLNVGDEVEVWGAQLEEGSTASDYIPTTSTISGAPRFDHDPATGESLGLLIEEARTNLLTYSEEFDNAAWAVQGTPTLTASSQLAPDGSLTSWDFTRPDGGGHFVFQQKTGLDTSATYIYSLYVKVASGTADFQLLAFDTATRSSSVFTATTEWQRFDFAVQPTATTANFYLADPESSAYGTALTVWGAQIEEGSFPTSYIPTEDTTVTRAADVAQITGTNFSSWYNQSEGTFYAEARSDDGVNGVFSVGSNADFVGGLNYDFNNFNAQWQGSVMDGTFNPVDGSFHKFAFTATRTSNTLAADGNQTDTGTATHSFDATELGIGMRDVYGPGFRTDRSLNGHIKRLAYFPVRKTYEELQELTS